MQSFSEMQALTLLELEAMILKAKTELLEIHMAIKLRQEKNTSKKPKLRQHIARLRTAHTEKSAQQAPLTSPQK